MTTRRTKKALTLSAVMCGIIASASLAQQTPPGTKPLFTFDDNVLSSRWSSPENLNGVKGAGGKENNGAKGRAFETIDPGETKPLLDIQGTGTVNRIWITIDDRSPEMLRSLEIEMYWDNEKKPAVSVPFGDFFGVGLGRTAAFQNALFASPEGRSFVCMIPMPFKKAAKIVIVNESKRKLGHIFFDVDFAYLKSWPKDAMYFHAYWNRDTATTLGKDFVILPEVKGRGRFLGTNLGINVNPIYRDSWWGEGEVKMYLDGDTQLPTIVGTGTEDYISTGWGLSQFTNTYAGCLVKPAQQNQWGCYRYHIPDPIVFRTDLRVTLQLMGGNAPDKVKAMQQAQVPLIPVTLDNGQHFSAFYKKDSTTTIPNDAGSEGWLTFYRSDDMSATAYFYLATPADNLPALQPLDLRTYHLEGR